jgi:hypothetical protein
MSEGILVRDKDGKLWVPNEEAFNTNNCWKDAEIIARGEWWDLFKIKNLVNDQRELEGNNVREGA